MRERLSADASVAPGWTSPHAPAEPIPTVDAQRGARPTFVPLHTVVPVLKSSSRPPFFCRSFERTLNTARMNDQLMRLSYPRRELSRRHGGSPWSKQRQHVLGQFVCVTRASELRQQSDESGAFPGRLRGVKSGTRERKQRHRMGD